VDDRLAAWLAHEDLDDLWRRVLRRPIEPEERAVTEERLAAGMSRSALFQELATSPEFEHVRRLDDAVAWATAQRAAGQRSRNIQAPPGSDERPIEIPWCLARYAGERHVLDVGYAFAEPAYLAGLVGLGAPGLTGVDLVAKEVPGLIGVQADLRDLPFEDGAFELAIAISTLEHIGSDNTQYGHAPEDGDEGALTVTLTELRRVLTTRGRLLVTVPTGVAERLPTHVVLPPAEWTELFKSVGFLVWEDELYELDEHGWRSVTSLSDGLRYGARGPAASAVLCAELRPIGLSARARLALRDLRHRDPARRST
jgi:SAM-dependent methyltransferase